MNNAEYTRWSRRLGRMRAENVEAVREAVRREAFMKQDKALSILHNCPDCNGRRACERCQEMHAQRMDSEELLYLTERRLGNIAENKLRYEFAAKHGRWPEDNNELYDWYFETYERVHERVQQKREAFNTLLGDIQIDL